MYRTPNELLFLFPIVMLGLIVALILVLRWFSHKEKMAMIAQGMTAFQSSKGQRNFPGLSSTGQKVQLARGLNITMIGLAITLGLWTVGIGPWLLVGLIPLFLGLAILLSYVVTLPDKPKSTTTISTTSLSSSPFSGTSRQPSLENNEEPEKKELEKEEDEKEDQSDQDDQLDKQIVDGSTTDLD